MGGILQQLTATDRRFLDYVVGRRHPRLDAQVRRFTRLGDAGTTIGAAVLLVAMIDAPDQFSFPSGHAASALSVAIGLALGLPAVAAALVVCGALLVGVSRCYLGVHYPGDVLAGWCLAAGAALVGLQLL